MWSFRRRRTKTRRARYRDNNPIKKQILIGLTLFSLLALLLAGVWYGSRVADWQIATVTVIGGPTIAHEDIEALVWEQLQGSYFVFVPRQFYYTYPEESILEVVRAIPRIKAATVKLVEMSELVVAFEEYVPEALWCADVSSTAEGCMFLDASGYAFSPAPTLQGAAFVRYVHSVEEPRVDATPFTPDFLSETATFSTWLTDTFGWYVTHIVYTNGIDIEYELAGGGMLKVTTQMPIETTQTNLEALLAASEMEKERAGDFEYIDLRFGDKVFIRDFEPEVVATSTDSVATSTESTTVTSEESSTEE